ncbi:fatty acid elongase [Planoprotostelium fungivorum]|uniref:Elongation of fatty acids protein n=1 Tax=Planoprotostelium fungivorum TaxID=1890364 RepID=A0A2P6NNR7_9EUKA|nr:fatty acid elongase [Planoprotostelium fungivorum]
MSLDLFAPIAAAYTAGTGKDISTFRYEDAPLSSPVIVISGVILYLVAVHGGAYLMRDRKPFKLNGLFRIHNLLLTIISGALLLVFIPEIIPLLANGPHYALCSAKAWNSRLEFLYYINYLIKWYELLDTAFLVLKKKNLEFLHYFHHSMTMALCFSQLHGRTTVSWVPITLNLGVHVAMYYYYYRAAGGHQMWWKKYLTTLQITQFIIDLACVYYCVAKRITFHYLPHLSTGDCEGGGWFAGYFGAAILTSYLLLFIHFYFKTYKRPAAAVNKKKQ